MSVTRYHKNIYIKSHVSKSNISFKMRDFIIFIKFHTKSLQTNIYLQLFLLTRTQLNEH